MTDLVSRFESLDVPEVRVRAALHGVEWVVVDWLGPELPAGSAVKAKLMRSQLCSATVHRVGALFVLRDIVRWWATQDPWDESFAPNDPGWLSPDVVPAGGLS